MADFDKSNPFFNTDFAAYNENLKWQTENNFNNQQAWDARLYGTWEREQTQQWNEMMYERALKDNSIGAQIERARDAGVNPASVVGGDYRSSQASAPTSSPQSPVQAHGGSGDAARMAAITQGADSLVNATKGFVDNMLSEEQIALNRQSINSQVAKNYKELSLIAAQAGVQNATEEQIRQAIAWTYPLNYVAVQEKLGNITKIVNELAIAYEKLGLDIKTVDIEEKLADSTINVNSSVYELNRAKAVTEGTMQIVNEADASLLELRAKELSARLDVANILGIPITDSPYEFIYALSKQGKLESFVTKALIPYSRGQMSPQELLQVYQENYGGSAEVHAGQSAGKGSAGASIGASGHVTYTTEKQHEIAPYGYEQPAPADGVDNPDMSADPIGYAIRHAKNKKDDPRYKLVPIKKKKPWWKFWER